MITVVMVEGGANETTVNSMCLEGGPVGGCFVDYNFGARGSRGGSVEVKVAVDGGVVGKAWFCTGAAEEVESEH